MARSRPKRLEFAATLDHDGAVAAHEERVQLGEEWSAESLVLAGLLRCSITSLRYHARRAGIGDVRAHGSATGVVTQRESDGRYAFVEVEARLEAEIEPPPAPEALAELLANAERDCFIGASLTVSPTYRWRVNGAGV